jgi:serine phosphatase RsbU (regulator of sigma subunit)/Tfp pilus assembly protein PilF
MLRQLAVLILILISFFIRAQQFGKKSFYLVDSLPVKSFENYDLALLDSILQLYHQEKSDTSRLNLLNFLAENLEDGRAWLPYNKMMLQKASQRLESKNLSDQEKRFYKTMIAGAYNNFGYTQNLEGNKEKALEFFLKSKEILEEINHSAGLSDVYNNIGLLYKNVGQISKCLEYYFKCLKICESLNDTKGKASSLNNIGMMYKELEEYEKSLEYLHNALNEWQKLDNKRGISNTFGNLGLLYGKVGKRDLALEYYFKALIINERIGDKEGIGTELGNIGWIYLEQGKTNKALEYFERSLQYRKLINDKAGTAYGIFNLGSAYRRMGNNELARKHAHEALNMGKSLGYPDIIKRTSYLLYALYKENNQHGEALQMHELFIQMRDSMINEQARKVGLKKQYQYEFELKEKELKTEQEMRELKYNDDIQRQRIIFIAAATIGIAFLIFSIVLYKRFRLTRMQKSIIEEQKEKMDTAFAALHEKNKEVMDSIFYARRIQNALLTSEEYFNKHLRREYFILYKPKDIVSGDFYWATHLHSDDENSTSEKISLQNVDAPFYLAVGDSTGHGVPGAFMSLLNIGFLSESINEKHISYPNEILNYTRRRLIENVNKEGQKDGFDGAVFCIQKDKAGKTSLSYAAANCKPLLIRNGEKIHLLQDRMPVGMGELNQPFSHHQISVEKNDMLYIFTDGFADQFGGPRGKKFKSRPLEDLLNSLSSLPTDEQQKHLNKTFDDWKGNLEQVDDVCVVGIRL